MYFSSSSSAIIAAFPIGNFGETIEIPAEIFIESLSAAHFLNLFLNYWANRIISSYGPTTNKSSPPE